MQQIKPCATAIVAACMGVLFILVPELPVTAQDTDTVSIPFVDVEVDEEDRPYYFETPSSTDSASVSVRQVSAVELARLKGSEDFWYINEAPIKPAARRAPTFSLWEQGWFKSLMWLLVIGGFIATLIWFLLSSNVQLFRRKAMAVGEDMEQEEDHENIFDIDYHTQIRKAVAAADLRLAIRLHYLRLLKDLAQKGAIQYSQGGTNSAYVMQVQDRPYASQFFSITRSFEYAWYGRFPVSADAFSALENEFANLRSRLSQ